MIVSGKWFHPVWNAVIFKTLFTSPIWEARNEQTHNFGMKPVIV